MAKHYPDVEVDQFHIDILTANFVRMPDFFDVVVGSNLFGDILSDLGPRFGARYCRQGNRQPDRHDLGRRDDAAAPRPPGRPRRHH
jgi:hypothetical protein